MERIIRLGTRGSRLALIQAGWVRDKLRLIRPSAQVEIVPIQTRGDVSRAGSFARSGDTGLFTKAIEDALLDGKVDVAVHSLKDLPTLEPPGLAVVAVPERVDPRDALVSREGLAPDELHEGMKVGTSSVRRKAQLLRINDRLDVVELHGNLDTRLGRVVRGDLDAIVVAMAGLVRMPRDDVKAVPFPFDLMLPAAGQGALAIEARDDDREVGSLLAELNDERSAVTTRAERMVLRSLGAGCHVPVGVIGEYRDDGAIGVRCAVFSDDGRKAVRANAEGDIVENVVSEVVKRLTSQGARDLIAGSGGDAWHAAE